MKYKDNLMKMLNINYLQYTNKTISCGEFDIPALYCNIDTYPDYIALYSQVNEYNKTSKTAISFFQYDNIFDGKNGIFWAIYFQNEKRLEFFKQRFKGVKYFITPDYSIIGDIHYIENMHRIFRARIVAIWFILEIGAIAIPNVTFADEKTADIAISGLEGSSVVAISTKGHIQDKAEKDRLQSNIKLIVDRLKLKAIVVYDVCGNDIETKKIFSYAINKGIKLIIPLNSLKARNTILSGKGDV